MEGDVDRTLIAIYLKYHPENKKIDIPKIRRALRRDGHFFNNETLGMNIGMIDDAAEFFDFAVEDSNPGEFTDFFSFVSEVRIFTTLEEVVNELVISPNAKVTEIRPYKRNWYYHHVHSTSSYYATDGNGDYQDDREWKGELHVGNSGMLEVYPDEIVTFVAPDEVIIYIGQTAQTERITSILNKIYEGFPEFWSCPTEHPNHIHITMGRWEWRRDRSRTVFVEL